MRHALLQGKEWGGVMQCGCTAQHGCTKVLHGIGRILIPWLHMSSLEETKLFPAEPSTNKVAASRETVLSPYNNNTALAAPILKSLAINAL